MSSTVMTRFGVKNYKCLQDVDVPLTPIHVIIGQNDSGKTSLLEAMLTYFRSSRQRFQTAFPGKWKGNELLFEQADPPIIGLHGTFQRIDTQKQNPLDINYGFEVSFAKDEPTWNDEWYCLGNAKKHTVQQHAASNTNVAMPHPNLSAEESNQLSSIKDCLRLAHLYQLDPKMMSMPTTIDPIRKFRMDSDGFGLASLLDDILGYAPERFLELRKQFCQYFPQFRSVRLEVQEAAQRRYNEAGVSSMGSDSGKGIYFETRQGRAIRAQQASDGAILFLGFLALTFLPEPPNLILIEEPEKGIYPKRLEEIVTLLRDVAAGTPESSRPQLILSTHSPYLLSFFKPEEITLMSRHAHGGVCARPLRDAPSIQERMDDEFYLGELWYNLSEEELFGGIAS